MRFRIDGTVDAPPEQALRTFHEKAAALAGRLPNVTNVEVITHDLAFTHLRWMAEGHIPRAFARVLRDEDLTWEDETVWDFTERTVTTKAHHLKNNRFQYRATMRFEETEDGSEYTCEGELRVEIALVGHMLERLFLSHVRDNMEHFFDELDTELLKTSTEKTKSPETDAPLNHP